MLQCRFYTAGFAVYVTSNLKMALLQTQRLPICFVLAMSMFAPSAMAHDMASLAIAFALVLAIPIPALFALVGWKRMGIYLIPIGVLALWLANSGSYSLMYGVLFAPYLAWIGRAVARQGQKEKHED